MEGPGGLTTAQPFLGAAGQSSVSNIGQYMNPYNEQVTNRIADFAYNLFNVDAGTYLVLGVLDGNNDGDFDDEEDAFGVLTRAAVGDGAGGGAALAAAAALAGRWRRCERIWGPSCPTTRRRWCE
jgi:hypothetical protein